MLLAEIWKNMAMQVCPFQKLTTQNSPKCSLNFPKFKKKDGHLHRVQLKWKSGGHRGSFPLTREQITLSSDKLHLFWGDGF